MAEEVIEMTGKELIDATQEAVIEVVSDVGNIIKTTTEEIAGLQHEAFYQSPEFWVGAAFMLVVVGLFIPIKKILGTLLHGRIEGVEKQIKDAADLRDEARKLLAEYEHKTENADAEVQKLLKQNRKLVNDYEKKAIAEFTKELSQQKKSAENEMKIHRDKIVAESSKAIIDRTFEILIKTLSDNMSDKKKRQLIDESIAMIEKMERNK